MKQLKQLRIDKKLTQSELAAIIGVGERQVRKYEALEQTPSLIVGIKWANALEISPSKLILLLSKGVE